MNEKFAVIDTETTWNNDLMSIGVVVSDNFFNIADKKYYIILPNKNYGGMYKYALYVNGITADLENTRNMIIDDLIAFLENYKIKNIFAYNALFDLGQLPELKNFDWFDIMKIAAYKQYNKRITERFDCYKTGRMKRGFGVENIYRLLGEDYSYNETHNAVFDAIDELKIMKMLNLNIDVFYKAKIK